MLNLTNQIVAIGGIYCPDKYQVSEDEDQV